MARCSSFGNSYSLHIQHLRKPSSQLRSAAQEFARIDWLTGVLAATVEWFLPRMVLVRLQFSADLSAANLAIRRSATHLLSHHVPCRLRSNTAWYLWRSLLALIRSIDLHLLAEAVARMLIRRELASDFLHVSLPIPPIMSTPSLHTPEHAYSPLQLGS